MCHAATANKEGGQAVRFPFNSKQGVFKVNHFIWWKLCKIGNRGRKTNRYTEELLLQVQNLQLGQGNTRRLSASFLHIYTHTIIIHFRRCLIQAHLVYNQHVIFVCCMSSSSCAHVIHDFQICADNSVSCRNLVFSHQRLLTNTVNSVYIFPAVCTPLYNYPAPAWPR